MRGMQPKFSIQAFFNPATLFCDGANNSRATEQGGVMKVKDI